MYIRMSDTYKIEIMSKESNFSDSGSRKQRVPPVKVAHKNSYNESEAMPQCSRLQQEAINCKDNRKNVAKQTSKQKTQNDRKTKKKKKKQNDKENPSIVYSEETKENETDVKKSKSLKEKETFPKYIPTSKIDEILMLKNSMDVQYVEGYLRINSRYNKHAYLSLFDDQCDLLIIGIRDRNRALDGDFVVARINPPEKWRTHQGQIQKTGIVICIREKIHSRKAVGCLRQRDSSVFFYPRDQRVPLIKIHRESLERFAADLNCCDDTLYLAVLTNWVKPQFAFGKIEKVVGSIGDVEVESNAILLEHDLDVTPYSLDAIEGLPNSDYSLTEDDLKDREDWRDECVFTIDPSTAVDLDDAVSCKLLKNKNYEIGVHIADVTHFLDFASPLDVQVSKRATTIYMADNVYHMLPKQLCQVCSLLPGQDKLAFSVIWELTEDAKIVSHRFAKTVIRSCCQMAYQHAQKFIENPEKKWPKNFLSISGNFTPDDLSRKVNILNNLAVQMRNKRFENGALRIDQPKLHVTIDRTTRLPVSYSIEEQRDSNRLIEEFMLLANMTVATHLYDTIPETALLRNHREPSQRVLNTTKETLQRFGIHLDVKSSASLHASIKLYEEEIDFQSSESKTMTKYRMMVINSLCSKAMARATYKCSSTVNTEDDLKHYALNVALYTHFTSPIRRYSDCVVHRLLYWTMQNVTLPEKWSEKLCKEIAAICNIKKYNAKMAQERSNELYFTYFVDLNGPMITIGIVLNVTENFIDVILCHVGIKLRISLSELRSSADIEYSSEYSVPTIRISWKETSASQVINVFTLLYLQVEKHPEFFQLIGTILPPNEEEIES
ncbi:DIS3-like exonuclease 2 isoform X1 [Osmia bicornis bicornis]|uniref:DIS3-like exonuclease 2 isoform X1 n=2 Tax=Osmia bicornis bicornis TaxID=1437191 RepID=UPI001EAEC99C|nr:DIS3-like exonuclease 2 isoform X1 [Osmia bicornis bicornis]